MGSNYIDRRGVRQEGAAVSLLNLTPAEFCSATNPCADGRAYALNQPTMAYVWDNCPRTDWLLWIADRVGQRPDERTLRLFAVWCVRNTPMADGRVTGELLTDPRSLAALDVAERYADGNATQDELAAAWDAAVTAAWDAEPTAARAAPEHAAAAVATVVATAAAGHAAVAVAGHAAGHAAVAAAWTAQADHLRTLVANPFRKEVQ